MWASEEDMAQYGQVTNKRQKTARDLARGTPESSEFFPGLGRVEYKPDAAPEETFCYRYYNPGERIHGRAMEEWLRPAVSFWHSFCYTGGDFYGLPTFHRSWEDGASPLDCYKRRIRAAFELYSKLGVKFWTVTDHDIAPEEDSLEDSRHNLDEVIPLIMELQQRTGVKPLWVAANLHYSPRYMSGAATSSDAAVFAHAGAQLKKTVEVAHKLGAECVMFQSFREAYSSFLNVDMARELRNYSRLLKMTADYKERLGYRGQLLLNCTGWEEQYDIHHQYTGDAATALCFLKHYSLDRQYKLSVGVSPRRQISWASAYGALGSVEVTGPAFSATADETTYLMKTIIEQQQYSSYHAGFGGRVSSGEATLEDCEEQAQKQQAEAPSQRTEHWEAVYSRYV